MQCPAFAFAAAPRYFVDPSHSCVALLCGASLWGGVAGADEPELEQAKQELTAAHEHSRAQV